MIRWPSHLAMPLLVHTQSASLLKHDYIQFHSHISSVTRIMPLLATFFLSHQNSILIFQITVQAAVVARLIRAYRVEEPIIHGALVGITRTIVWLTRKRKSADHLTEILRNFRCSKTIAYSQVGNSTAKNPRRTI